MIPFFKETWQKKKKNANNNFYKILSIEENLIEELNDHGMNQLVEDETPM
jgi:hypothetical protein